jgi:hypothetical protein
MDRRFSQLTVDDLYKAIPAIGSITQRQLARRLDCSADRVALLANEAIAAGLIEKFFFSGREKNFRRISPAFTQKAVESRPVSTDG